MAFILVQHLDPTHESLMVPLLAGHTAMPVLQATNGMPIECQKLYVIPPGMYLSVRNGAMYLSHPEARHGARLPFDFLLHSLAEDCGERAVCVILSGTGTDGSIGLQAVKKSGGLVIAQAPDDADYDGMPRNAIDTGAVDLVLRVSEIAGALMMECGGQKAVDGIVVGSAPKGGKKEFLRRIIILLRANTAHDFTYYKEGTLQRRIEQRMAMASVAAGDMERYIEILHSDAAERELLAKDLLINVTGFFRDRKVFDLLAKEIVPELVRNSPPDRPLRIWIAGCSTGEESYSIAMLFREEIIASKLKLKLQVFASDVDPDAVAIAREGLYPATIEADVSAERLSCFFSKEEQGYRVLPEFREAVVFAVQDVLADPPFSRIDFVSCRNLLIYLKSMAQEKVISVLHFALRAGGVLLLGSSETVGNVDQLFAVISKPARLYRHIGRGRSGELDFSMTASDNARSTGSRGKMLPPLRQGGGLPSYVGDWCWKPLLRRRS